MTPEPDESDKSKVADAYVDRDSGCLIINCGPKSFARFKQFFAAELAEYDLDLDEVHSIEIDSYEPDAVLEHSGFRDRIGSVFSFVAVFSFLALFSMLFGIGVYVTGKWLFGMLSV